jgi:nitrite reductase/ring-hydroxylating ferredoxin subunit
MGEWTAIGTLAELRAAGHLGFVTAQGPVCVVEVDGVLRAFDDECPHMGSELHREAIVEGRIICPWHRARFDLTTGKSLDLYASDLRCYRVTVVDGSVLVDPTPVADGDHPDGASPAGEAALGDGPT